jgi:hypothetical protein
MRPLRLRPASGYSQTRAHEHRLFAPSAREPAYLMTVPASTGRAAPVTYRASGEASQHTALGYVGRLDPRHRQHVERCENRLDVGTAGGLKVGPEHPVGLRPVHHVRVDRGGQDAVHPDSPGSEFVRQRPHQAEQPALGRGVMRHVRRSLHACRRASDHHRAALPFEQVRQARADRVPRPGQVDADHVLPVLRGDLQHGLELDDSRVRDDHVKPPELGHEGGHRSIGFYTTEQIVHVALDEVRTPWSGA